VNIAVDPEDPTPPYEQIRRQIGDLIGSGGLRPGERLPPLRQLAGDLGLAVGTVARAYRELEVDGLLASRRGGGTRVASTAARLPDDERRQRLVQLTAVYVARARALGASDAEIVQHVGAVSAGLVRVAHRAGPSR
jgi:GntR family transcriptional regulator